MKISVVIPVFNESRTIENLINKVHNVVLPSGIEKEIIVVDDGSTDETYDILTRFQNKFPIRLFKHNLNSGKSAAVQTGIKNITGEIVVIQDADLEYDPGHYPLLIEPILKNEADVVLGSRFMGEIKGMHFINRFANIISNITFNLLYPANITDLNTCYKVFKSDIFGKIEFKSKKFDFDSEVLCKVTKLGCRITEVPISYVARSRQEGKKISWGNALQVYWGIIKYRFLD